MLLIDVVEAALAYLRQHYGNAATYLLRIGVSNENSQWLQENLIG